MRFDATEPHGIDEADVVFARPDGAELLATVYRPRSAGPWPAPMPSRRGPWK